MQARRILITGRLPGIARRYEVTIVKLGGSIITDKTRKRVVRAERLKRFAGLLAPHSNNPEHHILVVLGGGSVGHVIAKRLRIDKGANFDLTRLYTLASEMYELKVRLARLLAEQGVAAIALQETSYIVAEAQGRFNLFDLPLKHALSMGLLPIMSGGLVFDTQQGARPLNGDLLPLMLDPTSFLIRRVVMLTNVPGVLGTDGNVIRSLDLSNRHRVAILRPPTGTTDVTGGMRSKVDVALRLAKDGIPTVICSGIRLDARRFDAAVNGLPEGCSRVGFSK